MKRFWKKVALAEAGEGWGILLDGRPVNTPGRTPLRLPTAALAQVIADEWRGVGDTIDPRAMPFTSMANAAIDRVALDRAAFARSLAAYGESDLLCYRADMPEPLVERQRAGWDRVLDWARARYDVHFTVASGVMHQPQPAATVARLAEAIGARGAFELAGLHPVVTISGSLVLALALLEEAVDADAAWAAARIDDDWQAEQWGEDAIARQAADHARDGFMAGARFLALLR